MIREDIKEYIDNQIDTHGYAFFPNAFPFKNLTLIEMEDIFTYLETKKIFKLNIARKIKWTSLPDNIGDMTSLTELIINCSTLSTLPSTISKLSNLTILSISRINLKSIPFSLKNLTKLKKLNLSFSAFQGLPDLSSLNKLETLVINNTNITYIPRYLCALDNFNLIDVRNINISYFPLCLIEKEIKIKTNDVANLGTSNIDKNSYKIFVEIKDELKLSVKQYLAYFNQFMKRSKNKIVNFSVDENEDGLILNFKVESHNDLENIKNNFSEYIGFSEKKESEIIPHIKENTSEYNKTMLMLELRQQVRLYQSMTEGAKDNLKVVCAQLNIPYNDLDFEPASVLISGVQKITESTPIASVHIAQNQSQEQMQNQSQEQIQKFKQYLSPLTKDFDKLINSIDNFVLKEEGEKLLNDIYPIMTKPTEEKIEKSGILPKLENFIDKAKTSIDLIDNGKEIYNKFAENYNGIAKILNYSLLAIL